MPRRPILPETLDLFDYRPPATAAVPRPSAAKAREPNLPELSDRVLLALLREVVRELHCRAGAAEDAFKRREFERSIAEALSILQTLSAKPTRRPTLPRKVAQEALHPAKRKAVRAALGAGVAPGQVAKHFGLSLADVRRALAEPE